MTLSAKKLRAIEVLLEAANIRIAAERLRISRKTLYEWLSEEEFKQELSNAKVRYLESVETALIAGVELNLNRLEVLAIGAESESVRLRAIVAWFDILARLRDSTYVEQGIDEIKELLHEQKKYNQTNPSGNPYYRRG